MGIKNFSSFCRTCLTDACIRHLTEQEYQALVAVSSTNLPAEHIATTAADGGETPFRLVTSENRLEEYVLPLVSGDADMASYTEQRSMEKRSGSARDNGVAMRYGVYVDASSFLYNSLLGVLIGNDDYTKYFRKGAYGSPVECNVPDEVVQEMASACSSRLINVLGDQLMTNTRRLLIAFDTLVSSSKIIEQDARRDRSDIVIAKECRERVWERVVEIMRRRLCTLYERGLDRLNEQRRADGQEPLRLAPAATRIAILDAIACDVMCLDNVNNVKQAYSSLCNSQYVIGEGEWKCFYRLYEDRHDVDVALVYGNDWDIALATLIYQQRDPNDGPKIHYVSRYITGGPTKRTDGDEIPSLTERAFTVFSVDGCLLASSKFKKNITFLALCVIGNDFVPRMISEMDSTFDAIKLLLDGTLTGDGTSDVANALEQLFETGSGSTLGFDDAVQALSTLITLLFKGLVDVRSLMKKRKRAGDEPLHAYLRERRDAIRRPYPLHEYKHCITEMEDFMDHRLPVHGKRRRHRSGSEDTTQPTVTITVSDALSVYVNSVLWYMSYCTYYKTLVLRGRVDAHKYSNRQSAREAFGLVTAGPRPAANNTLPEKCNFTMHVGLPLTREFNYNDSRVLSKFKFYNVSDFRRLLEKTDYNLCFEAIRKSVSNAFDGKWW